MNSSVEMGGLLRKVLGRSEAWKVRHDEAMKEYDRFEETLAEGIERFHILVKIDELWNAGVARGNFDYSAADEDEIGDLFGHWLTIAEDVKHELDDYRLAGFLSDHTDRFLACLEEARGICTPDERFFVGGKLAALGDQAIEEHRAGRTVEMMELGD